MRFAVSLSLHSCQRCAKKAEPASCARLIAMLILVCSAAFGQAQGLSITNYQYVSQQTVQRMLTVTYRADLVNTGTAVQALSATVTSLNTSYVQVLAGQDTLQFPPVPANSQVTSINTFTLQIEGALPVDFSQLQWTLQTAALLLPANVTVTPGGSVSFPVALGSAAPAGGVFVTLTTSNPSVATVSPSIVFISPGTTAAARVGTMVTGIGVGSATITASAPGYATAGGQVQVALGGTTATTMSFWPGSLTINQTTTQNLTLSLSTPAPAGLVVNLSSSDPTVASVPVAASFATGATSLSVPVTGVGAGLVAITASAPNIASATASVTVTPVAVPGIVLPASVTLSPGDTTNFPVALGTPAPDGGVFITLVSSNASIATVFPSTLFVAQGLTTPLRVVTVVTGNSAGSATITASASGYAMASGQVQVTGLTNPAPVTMSFSPVNLTINGSSTQNLTLNLSAPASAPLAVTLSSSNATVAAVPAAVSFGTGATSVSVPVTGASGGTVTITASAVNLPSATATVSVTQPAAGGILLPVSVTVMPGNTVSFPVSLGTVAPSGGVSITLASSDTSIATVYPSTFTILQGNQTARASIIVSGVGNGLATITASAFGYPNASSQVQVTGGAPPPVTTMSFSPVSLTINGTATQNLTLNLSTPALSALAVTLSSSDSTLATVPATVTVGPGAYSVSVPVTGVAPGSVTITASALNVAAATASVTIAQAATGGGIVLPTGVTVGLNQSAALPVTLPAVAPVGGATVSLVSSDSSTATVTPGVFIAAGATSPTTPPQITGLKPGSVTITASSPGFMPGSAQVTITAGGGGSSFAPIGGLTINPGSTQNLILLLSSAPTSPLTVNLSSSNPSVATVPPTVTAVAGSGSVNVPVTGVSAGSVTITSGTPGFGTATATVVVPSVNGLSVTWNGACWANVTINGFTGNYQAMNFTLVTPAPVVVNASLFYNSGSCDPTQGVDNMNDTGALTGSGTTIQGFTHFPNFIPSSAIFWIGTASTDGTKCPAGSLCSGCVTYTKTTPQCN